MFKKYEDINELIEDLKDGVSIGYDRGIIKQVAVNSEEIENAKNPIFIYVENPDTYFANTLRYIYSYNEFKQLTFSRYIRGLNYYLQLTGNSIETWNTLNDVEKAGFEADASRLKTKFFWEKSWTIPPEQDAVMTIELSGDAILNGGTIDFKKDSQNTDTLIEKIIRIRNTGIDDLIFTSPTAPLLLTDVTSGFSIVSQPISQIAANSFVDVAIQFDYDKAPDGGTATILILTNDPNNNEFVLNLESGILEGVLENPKFNPTFPYALDFIAQVGGARDKNIELKNLGPGSAEIISAEFDPPSSDFTFGINSSPALAGESIGINITYAPTVQYVEEETNLILQTTSGEKMIFLRGIGY